MYNKNKLNSSTKLPSYESPIDLTVEWQKLEQRMNKEKRKRIAAFWFVALLAMTFSMSIYISARKSPTSSNEYAVSSSALTKENLSKTNQTNDLEDHTNAIAKPINNSEIKLENSSDVTTNSNKTKKDYAVNNNKNKIGQPISYKNQSEIVQNNDSSKDQYLYKKDDQNKKVDKDFPSNKIDKADALSHSDQPYVQSNLTINALALIDPSLIFLNSQIPEITIPFINTAKVPNRKRNLWFDANMSIGHSLASYTNIANESIQLVNLKKKSELPLENIQWNLSIGKHIANGFYSKIGFQYTRANEKLNLSKIDTVITTKSNAIIETYTNTEGIKQEVIGVQKQVSIIERAISNYSNIKTLGLALLIGKSFTLGKSQLSIEAGTTLPLWIGYTGQTLAGINTLKSKNEVYLSNRNFSWVANTYYHYPIRKYIFITGGYTFTNNKLSTNLGYSKITDVHSLSIGLRYFIH